VYSYTWDAASQMKTAGGVTYTYDGHGRHAAKVGSKVYWYGSGGEILAETDATGHTLNEYVYFAGKRIAMVPASGSVLYLPKTCWAVCESSSSPTAHSATTPISCRSAASAPTPTPAARTTRLTRASIPGALPAG